MTFDEFNAKQLKDTTVAALKGIEDRINAMVTVQHHIQDAKDRAMFSVTLLSEICLLLVNENFRKHIVDRDMTELMVTTQTLSDFARGESLTGLYFHGIPRRWETAQKK